MLAKALKVLSLSAVVLAGLASCNGARDDALNLAREDKAFHFRNVNGSGRRYAVFVPLNYDKSKQYPMIVFLHGKFEGGSDAQACLRVGLAPFVADRKDNFPFICLFPQSGDGEWGENSDAANDALAAIEQTCREYSVDRDRISLTGLSTGGYGTWAIGAKYKHIFAALVPMGSQDSKKDVDNLVDMPIWAFHNGGDFLPPCAATEGMVDAIKSRGGNVRFTKYDAGGHNCWEATYSGGEVFTWLEQQRKSNRGKM